ncbi:DUF896 domain-containing protein [Desulfotomaculum copahuensis]|uniref:UPF0291 protein A6M21_07205 n=1 Tax=Desulfotomaculum copahuensis TaxID=1838280 RepID=A0A1B7LGF8_9FIRM|nr:DUF896 domain-containing protein [Desulfotomaculum copahuensis]OAT85004.1 hypothetical protein A6M21_07205 [Desulfotomaculum copahuensis]
MITKEMIERINFLSRKQRSGGLNDAEKAEQHALRQRYLETIRAQVTDALEAAGYKRKEKHGERCTCGHCHPLKH